VGEVHAGFTVAEQHDDQPLSQRLLNNDPSVLESVLRAYGPAIAGWLSHKHEQRLDREELRDILSTALSKLWEVRERYDPAKSSLRSFFFLLARHAAIDVLKSRWHSSRRNEVHLGDAANDIAEKATSAPAHLDPAGDHERSKKIRDLKACMDNLNDSSRRILWDDACSKDDGVPSGILAKELNLSESAVRVARKRGLDKLREAMRKIGY
jgi:RNA polymerase sigma factor (sigma-70 family)